MLSVGDYLIYTDPRIEQVASRIGCRPRGNVSPDPEYVAIMRGETPLTRDLYGGLGAAENAVVTSLERSGLTVDIDDMGVATISTGYVYDDAFRARLAEYGLDQHGMRFCSIDRVFAAGEFTVVQGAFYGEYDAYYVPSRHHMKKRMFAAIGTLRDGGIEKRVCLAIDGSHKIACRSAAINLADKVREAERERKIQDRARLEAEAEDDRRRIAEHEALMVTDADAIAGAFA